MVIRSLQPETKAARPAEEIRCQVGACGTQLGRIALEALLI
jgi:hypothetical protein